jgi:hypothetical protein
MQFDHNLEQPWFPIRRVRLALQPAYLPAARHQKHWAFCQLLIQHRCHTGRQHPTGRKQRENRPATRLIVPDCEANEKQEHSQNARRLVLYFLLLERIIAL